MPKPEDTVTVDPKLLEEDIEIDRGDRPHTGKQT